MGFRYRILKKRIKYNGSQMQSLWAYKNFCVQGDSIIVFRGECDISSEHIIDMSEIISGSKIYSRDMLHFIIEHFDTDIERILLRQRLFASIVYDVLHEFSRYDFKRNCDNIYYRDAKATISVATVTPVSSKIHFGINIDSHGTPIKTKGLKDFHISPFNFAKKVIMKYDAELASILNDRTKIRGVD